MTHARQPLDRNNRRYAAGKGVWRLPTNHVDAVGLYTTLPTAGNDFRGVLARTQGGTGVIDKLFWERKDAADAQAFVELVNLTDPQTLVSKTLTSPSFSDFTNATHDHQDTDDGGILLPAAMPSMAGVLITGNTFTGSSGVAVDNCFSASYLRYLILVDVTARSATTSEFHRINLRAAGSNASGAGDYAWDRIAVSGGASGVTTDAGDPAMGVNVCAANATHFFAAIALSHPFVADQTLMHAVVNSGQGGAGLVGIFGGWHSLANSYDGFRYFPDSGTITGSYAVIGYRQ